MLLNRVLDFFQQQVYIFSIFVVSIITLAFENARRNSQLDFRCHYTLHRFSQLREFIAWKNISFSSLKSEIQALFFFYMRVSAFQLPGISYTDHV